jgi:hypothetical protein
MLDIDRRHHTKKSHRRPLENINEFDNENIVRIDPVKIKTHHVVDDDFVSSAFEFVK